MTDELVEQKAGLKEMKLALIWAAVWAVLRVAVTAEEMDVTVAVGLVQQRVVWLVTPVAALKDLQRGLRRAESLV